MSFEVKNLIDYFVVVGLDAKSGLEPEPNEIYYDDGVSKPPLERAYKSKILNHFPMNLPWNPFDVDAVTQLCLPKGLVFKKNFQKPEFHPFVITREDGSRVFAGTFTFLELIEDEAICSAMQTLQTMYDAENSNKKISTTKEGSLSVSSMNTAPSRLTNHHFRSSSVKIPSRDEIENQNYQRITRKNLIANTTPITSKQNAAFRFSDFQHSDLLQRDIDFSNSTYTTPPVAERSRTRDNSILKNSYIENRDMSINSSFNNSCYEYLPNNYHQSIPLQNDSHYNMFKDRLYSTKCICLISQQPFNKTFKQILSTLYDMVEQTDLLGINLESHLYNIIYELPMPISGKLMKFHVGCRASIVHMPDYINGNDLPILDYDLFEFFQLFSVQNIISFYSAALLEHQILLYSKSYYLLMLIAECLTALFFPFTWLKPYVPIVPASNLHFIEAPVPYIMGFHHKDIDKDFFKQGQRCFVDIDSGMVTCPEDLPDFPDNTKFCKELKDLLTFFKDKRAQVNIRNQLKLNKTDPGVNFNKEFEQLTSGINSLGSEQEDILKNSQAYMRISELARKTGALNSDEESNRVKSSNRDSCSSGVSSLSGISGLKSGGNSDQIDKSENNSFEIPNNSEAQSNSFASTIENQSLKNLTVSEEELISLQFTQSIRELFLQHFVEMFVSYEKFVIVPNLGTTNIESWWTSREYSGNFDSKMFLIEQPSPRLPFLSHFIGTQMFASFIDLKIISLIDMSKGLEPNVKIFDDRVKKFKESELNGANIYDVKVDSLDIKSIETQVNKNMCQEPKLAPTVRKLQKSESIDIKQQNSISSYLFDNIEPKLLKADEEFIKKIYKEMKIQKESQMKKQFESNPQLKIRKIKSRDKKSRKMSESAKNTENIPVILNDSVDQQKPPTELNPIFIQSLLKESKLKTKRMLVEKMPEAVNLGHVECRISGVEENMLIASLCDLIERIWGHGLHSKPGKSALWNHLNNYRKLIQYLRPNGQHLVDPKGASPRFNSMGRKRSTLNVAASENRHSQTPSPKHNPMRNIGSTSNLNNLIQSSVQNFQHKRAQSVNSHEIQINFAPCVNDLLDDLARVDKLTEVKTEIGMARAFVRLSLEKKLLADHLRQLLGEAELLRALYKKHAFLRQEDEREQFIYHLQSLNVVDHFCFTNHFKSIPTDYSVILMPCKRLNSSTTSANPYIKLFGTLGESDVFSIPRNNFQFIISCNINLGPLTTLTIGHDNAGITPKWMIESIFVRNEITGHIHKFPCGRWLGRGIDDDSLERLLIAQAISHSEKDLSEHLDRSRSPNINRYDEKKLPASTVQEILGNSINNLLKFFERPESDKTYLTNLICGELGLVCSMENIFLFGYKSYKLFKRLYIWDFLEKAAYEFEGTTYSKFLYSPQPNNIKSIKNTDRLTNTIREINLKASSYGKDGKFQIFICLACKNSLLCDWFSLLSRSNAAASMYDEFSFLRNFELNKFCIKILSITNQFDFKLEKSLTMGINPI